MKTLHTKAPWRVERSGYTQIGCLVYAGDTPVVTTSVVGKSIEEWEANARLIASAPELLEALKECYFIAQGYMVTYGHSPSMDKKMAAIKAVIQKATKPE